MQSNSSVPVSVIIPCYCCADTIERAVTSVMSQTMLPAEVWLIDDASSDGGRTLATLYELKEHYGSKAHIEVIPLKENSGPAVARNRGWDAATQSYIAFLDADDAWHPRKLEVQYSWMQVHPHVALTGHPFVWIKEDNPVLTIPADWFAHQITPRCLLLSNLFSTPSVMLRRDLPYRFDPTKRHSEDYLLWLQIVLSGHTAWCLELPLTYLFKAPFGVRGLSVDLWKMEKGELDTYQKLRNQGFLHQLTAYALISYSLLKYIRRLIINRKIRLNADTISALSASFNNAISKSMYHIIPFVVVYSLPVGKDTDLPLYLYELYIFLSWTLMQSYEYIFTAHLTEKLSKFSLRTILFSTVRRSFPLSITIYLVYVVVLSLLLPKISGFNANENLKILKEIAFMSIGFPFGAGAAVLAAGLITRRMFFPVTLAVISGITVYIALFLSLKSSYGTDAFFISIVISEIIKFCLLFFVAQSVTKGEKLTKEYKETLVAWKNVMTYFLSATVGGIIPLILHSYATHLSEGAVTLLSYSLRLFYVLGGLFNGAVSFMLVIWVEKMEKDMRSAFVGIDKNIRLLFSLALGVFLLTVLSKNLFLTFISTNKDIIVMFRKGINIVFMCFPLYVVYLALIRFFIAIKKVYVITIQSATKLILVVSILNMWHYFEGLNNYTPLIAFSLAEGFISIMAYLMYIYLRNGIIANVKEI